MNYDEFSNKVDELGISKSDFLKHLDMSVPTMSHWSSKNEVPRVVALYLDLLIQVKQLQSKFNLVFDEFLPKVSIENEELSMVQPRLIRGPFTFDRYNIPVGAKLTWYKRPEIVCYVASDNMVIYKETIFSLKELTKQIFAEYQITENTTFGGLFWWEYHGVLLKKIHYGQKL
jgi:hypothetical protein